MVEAVPGIVTSDGTGLAEFYETGLGFETSDRFDFPAGVVRRLRRGAASLKIFEPAGGALRPTDPEPWHEFAGWAYAALYVDSVDREVASALAAGADLLAGPEAHRPGARFALIADPEGNVWELLEENRPGPG